LFFSSRTNHQALQAIFSSRTNHQQQNQSPAAAGAAQSIASSSRTNHQALHAIFSSRTNHQQQNQPPAAAAAQSIASSSRTINRDADVFQVDAKRGYIRARPKYSKSYSNMLEKDFSSFSK
jgi:hypothetical protein